MAKDWKEMERVVARKLGKWWGCQLRRTPSSGGWGKQVANSASDEFHGDIVAPPSAGFPFSVECKSYEEVEFYKAMYGACNILDWWIQCTNDAHRVHKHPMLVVRENRKQHYIVALSLDQTYSCIREESRKPAVAPRMTLAFPLMPHKLVLFDLDRFIAYHPKAVVVKALSVFTTRLPLR